MRMAICLSIACYCRRKSPRRHASPLREARDFVRQVDRVDRLLAEDVEAGGDDSRLLAGAAENGQREGGNRSSRAVFALAQLREELAAVEIRERDVADDHVWQPS